MPFQLLRPCCPAHSCWRGYVGSPADLVFFLGFDVPSIIRGVEVRIRGTDRLMAQIVPDMAQVDGIIRHMRSSSVAQPMRRRALDPKRIAGIRGAA